MTRPRLLVLVVSALLLAGAATPGWAAPQPVLAGPAPAGQPLVTWAASTDGTSTTLNNQTVRNIVTTSVAGRGLQVQLSNVFGGSPVTFRTASVGRAGPGASLVPGTVRPLRFGGSPSVTVPAGTSVLSDPIGVVVQARQTLAVSVYVDAKVRSASGHNLALTDSYLSEPGDHTGDTDAAAFTSTVPRWLFVQSIALRQRPQLGIVAALGDSITDGVGSTDGANNRWTDVLAERLIGRPPAQQLGVANEGISAKRVLHGGFGQSALDRFDRDVLAEPGVESVILLEGINDINTGSGSDELIAPYRELIARAHAVPLATLQCSR